jgi:four helix bundle protein
VRGKKIKKALKDACLWIFWVDNPHMKTYQDLTVWQKSIDLTVSIYSATMNFPKFEQYGLISQMRRATISIPSNIAEGFRRWNRQEFIRFLRIAYGSGAELETQLIIAEKLKFLSAEEYQALSLLSGEIMKMLNKLIQNLSRAPTHYELRPTP